MCAWVAPKHSTVNQFVPFQRQGDASDCALGLVRVRGIERLGISTQTRVQQQRQLELGLWSFLGVYEHHELLTYCCEGREGKGREGGLGTQGDVER